MSRSPTLSAAELESDRLLLRAGRAADREGLIDVFTDPEVRARLGGVKPREDIEAYAERRNA